MKNITSFPPGPRLLTGLGLALTVLALGRPAAHAADGTWTNQTSGGLWNTAANWSGGAVAEGAGATASFNLLDLAADHLVHLDGSHTLTALTFGDLLTGTAGSWLLDDNASSGANTLTLAGAAPTITVNALGTGKGVTNGVVLAGSAGLTKAGAGTLALTNLSTFTGGLRLSGGTLVEDFTSLAAPTDLLNSGNALTLGGGSLSLKGNATANASQTLGNLTVNAGGGQILINPNGPARTASLNLGTLTASTAGSSLLVGATSATNGTATLTTTSGTLVNGIYGGRVVWFNGTNNTGYDWATTVAGGSPYTLAGLASSNYTTLPASGGTATENCKMTAATTLSGAGSVNTLKLEAPGGDLALGANTLTLAGGGLLFTGTTARTITNNVGATGLMAGNGSGAYDLIVHQGASAALTIGAVIGDNAGNATALTKAGPGNLILSGVNTYTGGTRVNAGTLSLGVQANSALPAGSVTVQSGAILKLDRNNVTATRSLILNGGTLQGGNGFGDNWRGPITLAATSFIDSATTGNEGITNNVSGPGGLIKIGANNGLVVLGGNNTYAGLTTISAGILQFTRPAALYNAVETSWTPANLIVANGATLRVNVGGANDFTTTQVATLLGNLSTGINNNGLRAGSTFGFDTVNGGATLATAITDSTGLGGGAVGVRKFNANLLQFAGANTYTGATRVSAGTLQAGVPTVANTSGAFGVNSAVTVDSGSILDLNGYDIQIGSLTSAGNVAMNGTVTLTIGGNNTTPAAYSGIISDAGWGGNLTKIGTGTFTNSGASTYIGITTLNGGVIVLNKADTGSSGPLGNSGLIVLGGGTLQYSPVNQWDYSGRFSPEPNQAYKVDTANQTVTWATALTSAGGTLTKTNTGTLILAGANTYGGATTVNGGTLKAGVASVPGNYGAFGLNSAVTLANAAGVVLDLGGFDTQIGSLSGGGTAGGLVTNNAAPLTVGGDNTSPAAFAGVFTGPGASLVKVGTGTLTLNNTNTYTGTTTINGGTLALGSSGALLNTAGLDLAAGATYDVSLVPAPYMVNGSATWSARGTDLTTGAATLKGPAGGTIDLNARPMTLTFTPTAFAGDGTHPALAIAQGNLAVGGVLMTVINNGASPLNAGTYTLLTNLNGTFAGIPALAGGTVGGLGLAGGLRGAIQVSSDGKAVNLVVVSGGAATMTTLTRHVGTLETNLYGDTLWFDVTVSAGGGAVTLYDGGPAGTVVGAGILSAGACTITAYLNGLTVGVHDNVVAVYGGDVGNLPSSSAALTPAQHVGPKTLTVAGAVGNHKLYDGTAAATLRGTLVGVVAGDTATEVSLVGTGIFDNGGAVGTNLAIAANSTLSGTKAASYTLTQPTGVTASILSTAIWTSLAGGNWSAPGHWTNNLVGTGAGVTADFNTLNLTADTFVHLDSPRTIGGLIFGDTTNSSAGSWTLDDNGQAANVLTVEGTNSPPITVNALGTGKSVTILPELSLATNVTVTVTGPQLDLAGLISGAGGLTKNGPGILKLFGVVPNTYSGDTFVNSGTLHLGAITNGISPVCSATVGTGSLTLNSGCTLEFDRVTAANPLILNGGTLFCNNGWGASWNGPVTLNSNVTVNTAYKFAIGGAVGGAGGFAKTGIDTLTFAAANTFTGGLLIGSGTVTIGTAGQLGGGDYAANITNNATLNYGSELPQTLSGAISGTGRLQQNGLGTLTLAGVNTYTGATTVTNGVLEVVTPAALYNAAEAAWVPTNLTVASKGTLLVDVGGASGFTPAQVGTLLAKLLAANDNGLLAGSAFGFGGSNTATVSATLADSTGPGGGAVGLTKAGTGTVTLTGTNTYTGPTLVQAGELVWAHTNALGGGTVDITYGGLLRLNYAGTRHLASGALILDGAPPLDGTYGATGSGASTIDDVHFAGTGTLTVGTVGPPPTPGFELSGFTRPGGVPTFTFATVAGYKYRIVYTGAVTNAMTAWLPVIDAPNYPAPEGWSVTSGGEGMTISDLGAAGQPERFYRLEAATP